MDKAVDFSVLITVYINDDHIFFDRALKSIYNDQTRKPSQIVLVVDGPIGEELKSIIKKWKFELKSILDTYFFETNKGLGSALRFGLKKCTNNIVARMDSDDISHPERFETQLKEFCKNDDLIVCGSNVAEFEKNINLITGYKKVPEMYKDIKFRAKFRNPMNHPTVMFKRENILQAGSYEDMLFFEDYFLWVKCLKANKYFYNVQKDLVYMRAGIPQLQRRSGKSYMKHEHNFLYAIKNIGFINHAEYLVIKLLKSLVRMMPMFFVGKIYKFLRRRGA